MESITIIPQALFILLTLASVALVYKALRNSKTFLAVICGWIIIQGIVSLGGFYRETSTLPPRLTLLIVPPLLLIAALFFTRAGRKLLDNVDVKWLMILHFVRIPVEAMLYYLFLQKMIPGIITFEGRNLDILSGITAALALGVYFSQWKRKRSFLLVWNFISLGLLINIVVIAILSAPFSFQRFGFDQPNIAVLYFPFIYLPGVIVPFVFFSHFVGIRKFLLWGKEEKTQQATGKIQFSNSGRSSAHRQTADRSTAKT